jgi:hypothetical protein
MAGRGGRGGPPALTGKARQEGGRNGATGRGPPRSRGARHAHAAEAAGRHPRHPARRKRRAVRLQERAGGHHQPPTERPGAGYPMLDGCFAGYTQEDIDRRLAAWSAGQVASCRAVHRGPDMLFPWAYAGCFFVTAVLVFRCAFPARALWRLLLVLPPLNPVAGYAEDYLISVVVLTAGAPSDAATAAWASRATCVKWVVVGSRVESEPVEQRYSDLRRLHGSPTFGSPLRRAPG